MTIDIPPLIFTIIKIAATIIAVIAFRVFVRTRIPTRLDPNSAPKSEFGLRPVNEFNSNPSSDAVDIIFVHGLGSNPDTTWQARARSKSTPPTPLAKEHNINWITDFVYQDLPDNVRPEVRIYFYNYESYWYRDAAESRRSRFSQDLFEAIVTNATKTPHRSIVFVGHSYGGLVVKEAIVKACSFQTMRSFNVFKRIKAVVFLGTPHRGSASAWLGATVARILRFLALRSNPDIVQAVSYDSLELQDMRRNFEANSCHLKLVNFFETRKTRNAYGLWDELVVKEQSATLDRPDAVTIGLNTDHTRLNKFGERNGDYERARDKLVELIEEIIKRADDDVIEKGDIATIQKLRITDPQHDKIRIEQQKCGLLLDSYKWILSHEYFQRWRDGEGNQLLWIRGDAGKGKTMLLCGIIDELNKSVRKDLNVSYYFCQATNRQLNTATSVLQGLMHMLLSQQIKLLRSVRQKIETTSGEKFQDANGWTALCDIFGILIKEMEKRQQTTYLIVDALDECLEDRYHLLKWIAELSSSRIKILVSSRDWPEIENGLSGARQKVLLDLESNASHVSTAVDCYIDHKVTILAESKDLDLEDREAVQRHLKMNSSNTFLWVALVCQNLEDTDPWRVLVVLHKSPRGLDELYEQMATQFLNSENAELCRQLLAVQTLAYRPLSLKELLSLVETPEIFAKPAKWLPQIVKKCGSFLTVRDDTVDFVHQSAKDYLVKHMSDSIFRQGLLAAHRTIAIRSIEAASPTLQENMYQLPSPGSRIDSIEVPNPDPLNGIRYACVYWADHLEDAKLTGEQDLEDGGLVHKFLKKHLLHWLEALSLLRSLGSGIGALTKMLSLLRESEKDKKDLAKLVYDAMKFSRYYKVAIETAPLQLYDSAFVFSPTRSVVRKQFLKKPEWLLMSPSRESDWSPCLQVLEGHSKDVRSVAFSPSGRHLVSGSSDSTVRIWDVVTGGCLNVLEGHRATVHSVAFSPNNELVASGSSDGDIRIWNAKTGENLKTLESKLFNRRHIPILLIFADDRNVIFFDYHRTTYKCDITTGKYSNILEARSPLCFSRNGRRAAWVSRVTRASTTGAWNRLQIVIIL